MNSSLLNKFSTSTKFWIGTGLAVLIFSGLWLNARILLDQAKAGGTYAAFEEAVIAHAMRFEAQGVQIRSVEIDNSNGTPAVMDGKRQHLRWGCSIIQQEDNPANDFGASFPTCAPFIHTRDGWAMIDDDYARFVAGMMELYNLEGLRDFRAGNSQ